MLVIMKFEIFSKSHSNAVLLKSQKEGKLLKISAAIFLKTFRLQAFALKKITKVKKHDRLAQNFAVCDQSLAPFDTMLLFKESSLC